MLADSGPERLVWSLAGLAKGDALFWTGLGGEDATLGQDQDKIAESLDGRLADDLRLIARTGTRLNRVHLNQIGGLNELTAVIAYVGNTDVTDGARDPRLTPILVRDIVEEVVARLARADNTAIATAMAEVRRRLFSLSPTTKGTAAPRRWQLTLDHYNKTVNPRPSPVSADNFNRRIVDQEVIEPLVWSLIGWDEALRRSSGLGWMEMIDTGAQLRQWWNEQFWWCFVMSDVTMRTGGVILDIQCGMTPERYFHAGERGDDGISSDPRWDDEACLVTIGVLILELILARAFLAFRPQFDDRVAMIDTTFIQDALDWFHFSESDIDHSETTLRPLTNDLRDATPYDYVNEFAHQLLASADGRSLIYRVRSHFEACRCENSTGSLDECAPHRYVHRSQVFYHQVNEAWLVVGQGLGDAGNVRPLRG